MLPSSSLLSLHCTCSFLSPWYYFQDIFLIFFMNFRLHVSRSYLPHVPFFSSSWCVIFISHIQYFPYRDQLWIFKLFRFPLNRTFSLHAHISFRSFFPTKIFNIRQKGVYRFHRFIRQGFQAFVHSSFTITEQNHFSTLSVHTSSGIQTLWITSFTYYLHLTFYGLLCASPPATYSITASYINLFVCLGLVWVSVS